MIPNGDFDPTMPTAEQLRQFVEQIRDAGREASRFCLDAYETMLGSIASFQEQAASQTDVDWIAQVANAQARFTRELAKQQVSLARLLLTGTGEG